MSGSPRTVLLHGEVVLDDGRIVGAPRGEYVPRARRGRDGNDVAREG